MNRYIIVDGLPYLYADGKAYAVRWDEEGFTVGAEVELAEAPSTTYSEISVMAKCAECLNSIDPVEADNQQDGQSEDAEGKQEGQTEQDGQSEDAEPEPLEEMTVAELKAYAAEKGIELNGATKKAAIIEAIKAAE